MVHGEKHLTFSIVQENQHYYIAQITVAKESINSLYQQALHAQKADAHTYGFSKGQTPIHYIEHNFRPNILDHLKELFFIHCVMGFLCQSLYQHKIVIAGDPQLTGIKLDPQHDGEFSFLLTRVASDKEDRWKRVTLRAPERKNYKDLDRQVESFIKEEQDRWQTQAKETIEIGDWVCFDMQIVNSAQEPLLSQYKDQLWVKINDEESDLELQQLFLGKKKGDIFTSQSVFLQDYVSNKLNMRYHFLIEIKDYVPHAFFSFDMFKRHFQLKTAKEMHLKLIEVFSYRNDISQRRETVEATFKLLLKQYFLSLPRHLLEKQRQLVLSKVQNNPDYHVYKAQMDFKDKIKMLAEKQLKETIIIDTIAYQENVQLCQDDILGYLNLIKRPRTKEFIYFEMPILRFKEQEIPVSTELLKQYCLREKTLNHVIYQLTKN